jgi:hypothetical protein
MVKRVCRDSRFAYKKKDSGSARRRNNKYEKRAAARIALTCLFGQSRAAAVRTFFRKSYEETANAGES